MSRETYKRVEKVLLQNEVASSLDGIEIIEKEVKAVIEKYMKVSDMHVYFKKMKGGNYKIIVEGITSSISIPNIV